MRSLLLFRFLLPLLHPIHPNIHYAVHPHSLLRYGVRALVVRIARDIIPIVIRTCRDVVSRSWAPVPKYIGFPQDKNIRNYVNNSGGVPESFSGRPARSNGDFPKPPSKREQTFRPGADEPCAKTPNGAGDEALMALRVRDG